MDIGPAELIIVLIIALLMFGSSKLPKLARSMGEAQREFKKGLRGSATDEPAALTPPPDETVTMTRAELDAMLAEREKSVRDDTDTSGRKDL
jgi:sec-independent protein translocase protein TatA